MNDSEKFEFEIVKLVEWIKGFVNGADGDGVVIGLSGGIDSTVVANLCVNALGPDRVLGMILPCHSNPQDEKDAWYVAEEVGVHDVIRVDLSDVYDAIIKSTGIYAAGLNQVSLGNIKARLRMTALYTQANIKNYLVAGTGNKTELLTGYLTKFGDGGVDFEPIGDFYKTEVYRIAKDVLGSPERIIDKTPSAGLWAGQTDEDELGLTYAELDNILQLIQDNSYQGIPKSQLDKVEQLLKSAKHKNQTPPYYDRHIN